MAIVLVESPCGTVCTSTLPLPFGANKSEILSSLPVALIAGFAPVAAFEIVTSFAAEALDSNIRISLLLASNIVLTLGFVKFGFVSKTNFPLPVSSVTLLASCKEVKEGRSLMVNALNVGEPEVASGDAKILLALCDSVVISKCSLFIITEEAAALIEATISVAVHSASNASIPVHSSIGFICEQT